ncbi:unnamed protein product [Schistosoma margrebowiei]|uniref:Uncharacterized protein n=1 Tax=Schistosoma margrebowiei TaxID=48269 RepID=A0A183MFB7_9TREM|nr:unnamed protein product [Schistosoma margrebowiei]
MSRNNNNNNNNNNTRRDPMKMTNINKSNNQDGDALDTVIIPLNSSSPSTKVHQTKNGISKLLFILLILLLILILLFLIIASIIAIYYSNAYYKCQTIKG